jgi:probable addiction module antidote protein
MKNKRAVPYEDGLNVRLKDPFYAAEYLNAYLTENDEDAVEAFLLALRDVATAQGIAELSKKSALGRESLYKSLSKVGNPKIATLTMLLNAMGLRLSVAARQKKRRRQA